MPLYDYRCTTCGHYFEGRASIHLTNAAICPECSGKAEKQFTPNANIAIPGHFRMDRGWHLPPGGRNEHSEANSNSTVHAPQRKSFREKFDEAYKGG